MEKVEGPLDLSRALVGLPRRYCKKLVLGFGRGCRQALAQSKPSSSWGQPRTMWMGCWVSQLILQLRTQAPAPPGAPSS